MLHHKIICEKIYGTYITIIYSINKRETKELTQSFQNETVSIISKYPFKMFTITMQGIDLYTLATQHTYQDCNISVISLNRSTIELEKMI